MASRTIKQKLYQFKADKIAVRDAEEEQVQWQRRWAAILGLEEKDQAPMLVLDVSYPQEWYRISPTCRTLVFRLLRGQQFADVDGQHRKLASCLGTDRVVIERYTHRYDPTRECMYLFQVSYEKRCTNASILGVDPHLNPEKLCPSEQQFAVRWALGNAFSDVGLQSPIFIEANLKLTDAEVEWRTKWALPGTMPFDKLNADRQEGEDNLGCIRQHLGCNYLNVLQSTPKTFDLMFNNAKASRETVETAV